MSRYTYTLNREQKKEENGTYKRKDLEKMTLFHLREICRKERIVLPPAQSVDREGLIRLIMRFRGQKEYRHINTYQEGGLERIQEFMQNNKIHITDKQQIWIPGTIILYQETGMNELDGYKVKSDNKLYEGNLILIDEMYQIYTCFYIQEVKGVHYLFKGKDVPVRPLEKHQYFILYLPNERDSEFFYDCYYGNRVPTPGYVEGIRIPLLDIQENEIEEADLPLVIDFGSSNTTMGICLSDGTAKIALEKGKAIIPSIIGVKGVLEDKTEFVFGNAALDLSDQTYQDEDITVFYDIKRWVSDADRKQGVVLKNGYKYQIARKDMLRAYFDYLIDLARQQFKCTFSNIQLLAPIRQKEKFQELFKQLLPEFNVNCELDEGMAVLFNSINSLIKNDQYEKGRWYHALIIDCGGGTTDLTSGLFRIDNNRVSYIIDLETRYENGDTNFGGNNLTYRIMQMLKIRLAAELGLLNQEEVHLETGDSYDKLEELYQHAEQYLPTRFKDYIERSREQYFFVKNNYYYLFELAEIIKKEFFQSQFRYELYVTTNKNDSPKTVFLDKWKLSVCVNGEFKHITGEVDFPLYLNEIEELLRPDIYQVMEHFLDEKFEQGELQEYEMIKLTGQSCKSKLFTEALKQYVPGKLIQNTKQDRDGAELKMCCLEGALSYFMNCKLGYMKVNQEYQVGTLPYEIMALTHENKEKILIKSLDKEDLVGYISRFMIGKQLDLYLNNEQGKRLKTYYFQYDTSKFEKTTQEEIEHQYQNAVIQEETDVIQEGEMKFFVWVSRKRWGFIVLPILREGDLLYKGKETFFDFEDDTWELNFFDGRK